ncbi:MalY/PatB family protein [Deinococcus radiophilus]|uniref:cysteine-S-conjugate beta-lyase n=1 Tax=Deinococcus radiophilus TaxID=32062 RepID=A0A431W0M1_9DEIO|nr:aminotransferase class I/II-fold pyridoxal phosphate-dependent enzyme [Deinococcus radiophilus]RTR28679.1 aminotransferase class I/II-fold pyridoxal phosphate-dependent enzyme [Deinococcus radiophilus]UFA51102.1 aminotransferase class I/II-fold pyridoxal phosphate-dependent enzyme [Deinococcus radiophilus]
MTSDPQPGFSPEPHRFDSLTEEQLRHPVSVKWSTYPEHALPLWVADMDLPISDELKAALQDRLEQPMGYANTESPDIPLRQLLIQKLAQEGVPGLLGQQITLIPSVVQGLYAAVAAFTQPGEEVVALTPTYPPFHHSVQKQGRVWKSAPLVHTDAGWQIDWDALEAAITPQTRLMLLCHPHNPTGRIWTDEERRQLAQVAKRHDLTICSDELHADLCYPGAPEFRSMASEPDAADRTVVLTGPGKAYNLAGIAAGAMISRNPELLERIQAAVGGLVGHLGAYNASAWELALTHAQPWREEVMDYLHGNRELVREWAESEPLVRFTAPEATYLAWLDLHQHPQAARMQTYLIERGVALNDGTTFTIPEEGSTLQGFVRLNFATSRPVLREALSRLSAALQ